MISLSERWLTNSPSAILLIELLKRDGVFQIREGVHNSL